MKWMLAACALAATACAPDESSPVASDALYSRDNPGRNLVPQHEVANYRSTRELRVDDEGSRFVVVRELDHDGEPSVVVVKDGTLKTGVVTASKIDGATRVAEGDEVEGFRYPEMLDKTRSGVLCHIDSEHTSADGMQLAVTIDLCQSRRVWDEELFTRLVALSEIRGEPTPVGVALTGLWAQRHTAEFARLVAWNRDNKLDITWINHSYSHQLSKDAQGHYHFLTAPSVDFEAGVLDLEQLLIEQGQTASVLFRFPGLTHDARTLGELNDLSLFPMDANGWLAKGEPAEDGSIVLLHGNGNEPPGVSMFLNWADAHADELANGAVQLVSPLEALPSTSANVEACAP